MFGTSGSGRQPPPAHWAAHGRERRGSRDPSISAAHPIISRAQQLPRRPGEQLRPAPSSSGMRHLRHRGRAVHGIRDSDGNPLTPTGAPTVVRSTQAARGAAQPTSRSAPRESLPFQPPQPVVEVRAHLLHGSDQPVELVGGLVQLYGYAVQPFRHFGDGAVEAVLPGPHLGVELALGERLSA